ncbi:RING FINGER DOMAIN-CONTAINING [Salix viminalis]|uniref:RING FINGER DOMAIN-CONTAINING n=1 Tax=Salix viminalis TaxID=40686 RepID=A0A9Q0TNC2_SALVM|nr:RING FINGER DOMAIN-CONTAINING [Salix viminalis]
MEGIVHSWHLRQSSLGLVNPASSKENPGLDSSQIQLFPTFTYSSVKDFRREQYGLECAICLAEFSDEDLLRLLTSMPLAFMLATIAARKAEEARLRDVDRRNEGHEKILGMSRSHSTGHSILATREEEDRYTLRLMERVQVKITRGHCATGSCIIFGDYSGPMNDGYGGFSGWSHGGIKRE